MAVLVDHAPCVCVHGTSDSVYNEYSEKNLIARRDGVSVLTHTSLVIVFLANLFCLCLTLLAQVTKQQHLCITCDSQCGGGIHD